MSEFIFDIFSNEKVVFVVLALILGVFTELVKIPYKKITEFIASKCKKEASKKYLKSLLNGIIAFVPLGLGVIGEYVICLVSHETFDAERIRIGIECGGTTILGYLGIERVFFKEYFKNKNKGNDDKEVSADNLYNTADDLYNTKEAQDVKELAQTVIKDGKIDKTDLPAVKDFLNKFGKK